MFGRPESRKEGKRAILLNNTNVLHGGGPDKKENEFRFIEEIGDDLEVGKPFSLRGLFEIKDVVIQGSLE